MPSSTSNFDFQRVIPDHPWRGMAVLVALISIVATIAWEVYARSAGYMPTLNDTEDLWAETRRRVTPGSLVIVGDSRPHFDLDLDELERGLGSRPIQLAQGGSCAFPVFKDVIDDEIVSRHDHLQHRAADVVRARRSAGRKRRARGKARGDADMGAMGQSPPRGAARRTHRVPENGRARHAWLAQAHQAAEPRERARSARAAALLRDRSIANAARA